MRRLTSVINFAGGTRTVLLARLYALAIKGDPPRVSSSLLASPLTHSRPLSVMLRPLGVQRHLADPRNILQVRQHRSGAPLKHAAQGLHRRKTHIHVAPDLLHFERRLWRLGPFAPQRQRHALGIGCAAPRAVLVGPAQEPRAKVANVHGSGRVGFALPHERCVLELGLTCMLQSQRTRLLLVRISSSMVCACRV